MSIISARLFWRQKKNALVVEGEKLSPAYLFGVFFVCLTILHSFWLHHLCPLRWWLYGIIGCADRKWLVNHCSNGLKILDASSVFTPYIIDTLRSSAIVKLNMQRHYYWDDMSIIPFYLSWPRAAENKNERRPTICIVSTHYGTPRRCSARSVAMQFKSRDYKLYTKISVWLTKLLYIVVLPVFQHAGGVILAWKRWRRLSDRRSSIGKRTRAGVFCIPRFTSEEI